MGQPGPLVLDGGWTGQALTPTRLQIWPGTPIDKAEKTKNKTHSVDFFFMLPEVSGPTSPNPQSQEQGTKNAPYLHQCDGNPVLN